MTKTEAARYINAWGPDKTAENVAFYTEGIEFLIRKYCPEMLQVGNEMAALSALMRRAALEGKETKMSTIETAPNSHPEDGGPKQIAWEASTIDRDAICREMFECGYSGLRDQVKRDIVDARFKQLLCVEGKEK